MPNYALTFRDIRLTYHVMSRDYVITYWATSFFDTSRGILSRFNPTSCASSYRGRVTYFSVNLHHVTFISINFKTLRFFEFCYCFVVFQAKILWKGLCGIQQRTLCNVQYKGATRWCIFSRCHSIVSLNSNLIPKGFSFRIVLRGTFVKSSVKNITRFPKNIGLIKGKVSLRKVKKDYFVKKLWCRVDGEVNEEN